MYEPDKTDLKIIGLLLEDGRMPAAEVARRVGNVSERAVRYRIEQMVKDGLIHIGAVVNPRRFGFSVVADVFVEAEPAQIQELAQSLAEMENVTYVACSIGELDISIQVVARDTEEVYRFATEVIGKLPGVRKTTTSIVPFVVKDVYHWRPPHRSGEQDDGP